MRSELVTSPLWQKVVYKGCHGLASFHQGEGGGIACPSGQTASKPPPIIHDLSESPPPSPRPHAQTPTDPPIPPPNTLVRA